MGNKLYVSWYQAGLQVFDITDPAKPEHIGQYDTYPREFMQSEEETVAIADEPWDVMCGRDSLRNALPTTYSGAWAVFPFLGEDRVLIGDLTSGLITVDVTQANSPPKNQVSDFDGDGITDHSVFAPSTGMWYAERSSDQQLVTRHWGVEGDVIVPGDFDGDGKSDFAIWRPSTGTWWVWFESGGLHSFHWGVEGDIPVAGDYDADGRTDYAIWRPATGMWWIARSTLGIQTMHWGVAGDIPITGDYDGDGKTDFGIWRPSTGMWWIMRSSSSIPIIRHWGEAGDMPVAADFSGDGKTDFAIWRPSTGMWWIIFENFDIRTHHFGIPGDRPIPSDFDGDGKADISVFRPSTNVWYRLNSSDGAFIGREFGAVGDIPSPASSQPQ
ncbi:MAG: VCBS repeat-containing protein [Blastocatellia bacterium]|nr:VCBS repeat-containing protein [Blastocatellia bacterium]